MFANLVCVCAEKTNLLHGGDLFVHLKVICINVTKLGYSQGEVNILSLEESWLYVNFVLLRLHKLIQ